LLPYDCQELIYLRPSFPYAAARNHHQVLFGLGVHGFLLISGAVLPAAGVLLHTVRSAAGAFFGLKYGTGLGMGVLVAALVVFF
jgi:hypothetical protein